MCVVCRTPLAVANGPQADAERRQIRELIAQGKSEQQIKDALVAQYGERVLALPRGRRLQPRRLPRADRARRCWRSRCSRFALPRWRRRARVRAGQPGRSPRRRSAPRTARGSTRTSRATTDAPAPAVDGRRHAPDYCRQTVTRSGGTTAPRRRRQPTGEAPMTRTGAEYVESLRDGREVWIDGERVADVTTHPAFRNTVRSIAHLYDMTHDPALADVLTTPRPRPASRSTAATQIPRSHGRTSSRAARRRARGRRRRSATSAAAPTTWPPAGPASPPRPASSHAAGSSAPTTCSPTTRTCATTTSTSRTRSSTRRSTAPSRPPSRRSRSSTSASSEERDDGIVVRGAKMVGTAALFGDEIFVGTIEPLGSRTTRTTRSRSRSPSTRPA